MNIELVVLHPFNGYAKGDLISDPDLIKDILSSAYELNVIKKPILPRQ